MPGRSGTGALLLAACCFAAPAVLGRAVSRTPPPEYREVLEPRLSWEALLPDGSASRGGDGVVLLDEEVHLVDPSGRVLAAIHRRIQPRSHAGAERASRIAIPFRSGTEKTHLALARRIRADGTVISVRDDAVLLETPQLLVDRDCYADVSEIVILFPGAGPGDVVEYVVVKEIDRTIPGEYTAFLPVADPWPQARSRRQVLLPREMAARFRFKTLGLGDAEPRSISAGGELVGRVWEFQDLDALRLEHGREPIRQAGPGIWLSTIESWTAVGAWFLELLAGTDLLDEDLQRLAEGWRDASRDSLETATVVARYVSENVDYLALEFGMGSYRPNRASEVWRSRFGDCKDQANLVRVLLGALGVRSYLALVNTRHAGLIEESVPDFRQFNHVLLAVPIAEGGYAFLDPTAPALANGRLPVSYTHLRAHET